MYITITQQTAIHHHSLKRYNQGEQVSFGVDKYPKLLHSALWLLFFK